MLAVFSREIGNKLIFKKTMDHHSVVTIRRLVIDDLGPWKIFQKEFVENTIKMNKEYLPAPKPVSHHTNVINCHYNSVQKTIRTIQTSSSKQ